jgi:hypothetical protein
MAALFKPLFLNTFSNQAQQLPRGRYADISRYEELLELVPCRILDLRAVEKRGDLAEQPFAAAPYALLCELTVKYYFVSTILA